MKGDGTLHNFPVLTKSFNLALGIPKSKLLGFRERYCMASAQRVWKRLEWNNAFRFVPFHLGFSHYPNVCGQASQQKFHLRVLWPQKFGILHYFQTFLCITLLLLVPTAFFLITPDQNAHLLRTPLFIFETAKVINNDQKALTITFDIKVIRCTH